ncbi:MAG TPA: hypothetical protein VLB84_15700 [Bacteroidia bacterium]|nr:hypothetical protein [Bacteroidia bacterium]
MNSKLISFIVKYTDLNPEQTRPELRLGKDIGFYGLEAISFFEAFFSEFKIENIEDLDEALHVAGGEKNTFGLM